MTERVNVQNYNGGDGYIHLDGHDERFDTIRFEGETYFYEPRLPPLGELEPLPRAFRLVEDHEGKHEASAERVTDENLLMGLAEAVEDSF